MKFIKYLTCLMLFLLTFIFIVEIYVWNLDSFETEYQYVTYYLQKNTTKSEMLNDIYEASHKEKVEVFVIEREMPHFTKNIKIYSTKNNVKNHLAKKSAVEEGTYSRIFLGTVSINFDSWNNISDISKFENYFVIGNDKNIVNFKRALVDKYAGRFS